jgi:hypothetical protein
MPSFPARLLLPPRFDGSYGFMCADAGEGIGGTGTDKLIWVN